MDERLKRLMAAARNHAENSPEIEDGATHEVGDLQDILARCWVVMNDGQRACVYGSFAEFLEENSRGDLTS